MTRAKPPLQPHLLTRSDLELLQVPSDHVSAWLADGSLEPAGSLPGDASGGGEPVFSVTTNVLRQDLALRLLEIDKPVVVMTPPRVRSLLQRFAELASPSGEAAHEEALAAVVAEVQADARELLQFAQAAPVGAGGAAAAEDDDADEHAEAHDGACFDAGDLERALDALQPPTPAAEPELAAAAAPTTSGSDTTMVTESATAVLQPAPALRTSPPTFLPPPEAGDVVLAATIGRVDAFLERLQQSLLGLARQSAPATQAAPPPPTDVTALVQAVHAGFERVAQSAATTHGALAALGERVGGIGTQLAAGVDKAMRQAVAPKGAGEAPAAPQPALPPVPVPVQLPAFAPTITFPRQDRLPAALLALATCVLAWSLLFWWKTGSQQLAVGALVGANLIGCCLLAARRARA